MAKHASSSGDRRLQEKKQKIQTWLLEDEFRVSEQPHEHATWVLIAESPIPGPGLGVIQEAARPDRIMLQGRSR